MQFDEGVCYACGRSYVSKVGTFSPGRACPECGAPVCNPCWMRGVNTCAKHPVEQPAAPLPAPPPPSPVPAPALPASGPATAAASPEPQAPPKPRTDEQLAGIFLNSFESSIAAHESVYDPRDGKTATRSGPVQRFRRAFGEVRQVEYRRSGLFRNKRKVVVAAIALGERAFCLEGRAWVPSRQLLRQIPAPDGLEFDDDVYYLVGIYSPEGWPKEWRTEQNNPGNAAYVLVEKGEGTAWRDWGIPADLPVFNPESGDERRERILRALGDHPELASHGGLLDLEKFAAQLGVGRVAAEEAFRDGKPYRIIEHKGRAVIVRTAI